MPQHLIKIHEQDKLPRWSLKPLIGQVLPFRYRYIKLTQSGYNPQPCNLMQSPKPFEVKISLLHHLKSTPRTWQGRRCARKRKHCRFADFSALGLPTSSMLKSVCGQNGKCETRAENRQAAKTTTNHPNKTNKNRGPHTTYWPALTPVYALCPHSSFIDRKPSMGLKSAT